MSIKYQLRSSSGFSLIELLTVIALVAVLSAAATPSILQWRQNANLNSDMRRLYGFFQKARLEAVKQSTTCNFNLDGITYSSNIGAQVVDSGAYSDGVTSTPFVGSFDRRGLISAGTTIIVTGAGGNDHRLVINRRGRMRIQ